MLYKIIIKQNNKILFKEHFFFIKKKILNYTQVNSLNEADAILLNEQVYFITKKSPNNLIEETEFDNIIIEKVEDLGDLLTELLHQKEG